MSDLISRPALLEGKVSNAYISRFEIEQAPTVDAVEVDTLKAWLYEIAMNNTGNYLCDACGVIISRIDGLRTFARERKEASK